MTLGKHGVLTPDQARGKAEEILSKARLGEDPAQRRTERRNAITIAELADEYLRMHAAPMKKASSVREDRSNLKNHVLPAFGRIAVMDLTRDRVEKWMATRSDAPANANLCLALLRHMMTKAEDWGHRKRLTNPCTGIGKFDVRPRERYLSAEELSRLGSALDAIEAEGANPKGIAILRLLALTGARKGEMLALKWDEVDSERGLLRLGDSKTGRKTIPIGESALAILAALPRTNSAFVFPSKIARSSATGLGHYQGLTKIWLAVRAKAGLPNVRVHDLRHTAASVAVANGASLPMIAKILGHADTKTTQRYAHLSDAPVRAVAEGMASSVATALARRL